MSAALSKQRPEATKQPLTHDWSAASKQLRCYIAISFGNRGMSLMQGWNKLRKQRNCLLDHPTFSCNDASAWTSTVVAKECRMVPRRVKYVQKCLVLLTRGWHSPKQNYSTVAVNSRSVFTEVSTSFCYTYSILTRQNSFYLASCCALCGTRRCSLATYMHFIHLHCCTEMQGRQFL